MAQVREFLHQVSQKEYNHFGMNCLHIRVKFWVAPFVILTTPNQMKVESSRWNVQLFGFAIPPESTTKKAHDHVVSSCRDHNHPIETHQWLVGRFQDANAMWISCLRFLLDTSIQKCCLQNSELTKRMYFILPRINRERTCFRLDQARNQIEHDTCCKIFGSAKKYHMSRIPPHTCDFEAWHI